MQLPEIPDKIPVKKRKILGPMARFLLNKHNWSIVGEIPDRKKMRFKNMAWPALKMAKVGLTI